VQAEAGVRSRLKKHAGDFFINIKKVVVGEPKHMPIFFKKKGKKTKYMLEIF
jgi:hypothetical protein